MRIRKTLAVSVAGLSLAAAATLPALAASSHSAAPAVGKHGSFRSHLTPKTGVTPGTAMTLSSKKAHKKTNYTCAFTAVKGKKHAADASNIVTVKSNKKGHFSCTLTFQKFHGTINGHKVHCPQTKKDKKRGVKCGMAAANILHRNTDNTIQYFKSHR